MANQQPQVKLPYDPSVMTVVIIDDHDPIRKAIRRVLSSMGFKTIQEYFDGYDALKAIAKEQAPIDLIISDLYMRKITGFQVLKKIRAKSYGFDIPIVIVTGEGSKEDIVKAVDLGADEYVLKPFQIAEIEKKVTSVLIKYHSPPPLLKLVRQGERLLAEGQYQDALKLFEAAERLDATSARARYCRALTLDKMGHVAEALSVLQESVSNNTTYYKNYATIADIHLKMGRKNLGIDALKSELELNPKQAQRQALLADLLMSEGDYVGALEHYRLALRESQNMKDALLGMGKAHDASGNQEKAIYYFRRARRQHPDLTAALELMVQSYEAKGEGQKVIPIVLDDIRLAPSRIDARVIASQLYVKYQEIEKALKVLDDGLIRDPNSTTLLKAKAKVLLSNRDAASAVNIYQKVIALEPTTQHYTLLGLAQTHNGQYKDAIAALITALRDTHDRPKVLSLIAEVLKRSNDICQAVFILQLAIAQNPKEKSNLEADIKLLLQQVKERRTFALEKSRSSGGGRQAS